MRTYATYARWVGLTLVIMLLGAMVACGGGKSGTHSTLPSVGRTAGTSGTGFEFTDSDIPNLSPELQGYLALPGWNGPASPVPPVSGAPAPKPISVEEFLQMRQELFNESGDMTRSDDPQVPVKGSSYAWIPPTNPDYFPGLGEYDTADWNPNSPTHPANPPFGLDENEDGIEDLFANVDQLNILTYASFVKHGVSTPNQFNRGSTVGGTALSAVYQAIRTELGNNPTGELAYREAENAFLTKAYRIPGLYYKLENLTVNVKRFSDPTSIKWFALMIGPAGEIRNNGGAHFQSIPDGPNQTKADYQGWSYDPIQNPFVATAGLGWGDSNSVVGSIMMSLQSSNNTNIQTLITKQTTENLPWATFGTFGLLMQRWIDDRFSPLTQPWEGRLGWPLGDPFIDRGGRVLVGPIGQYYRYGQYFEKGYMWWNDYLDPNIPDELYVYIYNKDSTLDSGGTYTQDPMVVRYGLGGPLGLAITVNPKEVNVGDPVYLHGFPYGGPTGNVNGFADDIFVWNYRNGTYFVGDGTELTRTTSYLTEAKFTTRVLLVLDVNGDGLGDGATPGNYVFADAPEVMVGHLGDPGGGGGGAKTTLLVQDDSGGGNGNSAEARKAVQDDLDALGFSGIYDLKTTAQITSVAQLTPYKMVIWCPARSDQFYLELISSTERTLLTSYITGGGNVMICTNTFYNSGMGYPTWQNQFGVPGDWAMNPGWDTSTILTGGPAATGPAGSISYINKSAIWTSMGQSYELASDSRFIGYSNVDPSYYTATLRDNRPSSAGGMGVFFGVPWNEYTTTSPSGAGRKGVLWNILNFVDPTICVGGGPSGETILPYDGPVDIADVFAWVYNSSGGTISGGNGDLPGDRATISVISTPKSIWFEAMARAKAAVSLLYDWEFEPSAGYTTWTKYTSHSYIGGITPPGGVTGDPFPVNVRCYNSTYGSYAAAPPADRDSDSVLVSVAGALPVDINDNGSTFAGQTFTPDGNGDVTFTVLFTIANGIPPYDSVWVDYDYNFTSFQNRVQVTPTPGEGPGTCSVTIPDIVAGHSYYIAIRVNDADAPNLRDTYVWTLPVKGGSDIAVVNDGGTANKDAIEADLNALGVGYTEVASSSISSGSQLASYKLVIWCPPNSEGQISTSETSILMNYVQTQHGNLFIPYQNLYSNYDQSFCQMLGFQYTFWTWFGSYWPCGGNDSWGNPYIVGAGPGGTITQLNSNYISPCTEAYYYYYQGGSSETHTLIGEPGYAPSYVEGLCRDNYTAGYGGMAAWIGMNWNDITSTTPSTPGRSGALWNIMEYIDPALH
jgi:hypothetical protein